MKTKLKNIASNPYVQSAFVGVMVTLLVYFVWDAPITRYNIDVNPMGRTTYDEVLWFVDDFDSDGNSERIRCFQGINTESLDIVNYDHHGNLIDNHHYPGYKWHYRLTPKIFDTNEDGIKELLYFDERNDSIFFNAINLKEFTLQIDHHFFHKIERHRDNYAYQSHFYELDDFDKSGTKELIFSFDAGYGLYPRGIFKLEFPSLQLTASPTEHMVLGYIMFSDLNADNIPEILPKLSAPSNSYNAKKYADTCSYLVALDINLQPIFEPIKMQGSYSYVSSVPCFEADSLFFALCQNLSNMQKPAEVVLVNAKGEILRSKAWSNMERPENTDFDLAVVNDVPYLIISNVGRFALNTDLTGLPDNEELDHQINKVTNSPFCYDFNKDGTDEIISWNSHDVITILDEKTNESFSFASPIPYRRAFNIYPYYVNDKVTQYAFATLGSIFFLKYQKNPFYFLLYVIYLVVFLLVIGLIYAILFYQKRTIEKKWTTEKQLSELQFNAVKNQLNPHFLFNTLNSVAYMINEGKKDEAYDFLAINSRMIQRVMNDAKEVKRPLKDEIQFTKDYITIQEHRFKNRFTSEFEIHTDVNLDLIVPKMCVHTYVENAIKHGFRNTKSGGLLKVIVEPAINGVSISVSDNGMGRKAALEYKDSTGNGIAVMNEFYQLFEKYHGYKIDFSIGDNSPVGTLVELVFSLDKKSSKSL